MLRVILPLAFAVVVSACRPPAPTPAPAGAAARLPAASRLAPGVFILHQWRGRRVPGDLKPPPDYDPRQGGYFERVLGGRLYLMPTGDYLTIICAEVVDSAGRVLPNTSDRQEMGDYWMAGRRVYFSNLIVDGPPDSTAARIHGDTLAVDPTRVFIRDRASVLPQHPPLTIDVCPAIRAAVRGAAAQARPPGTVVVRYRGRKDS